MDRGAWQATVHGVARVRHDLGTKPREKDYSVWQQVITVFKISFFFPPDRKRKHLENENNKISIQM